MSEIGKHFGESMAITETSTGIQARRSFASKLIRHDSLKAKSHAPLRPFISLCHCGVESKRGRMRRVRIVADYEYHDGATEEAIAQLRENAHTDVIQRCRARGYTGTINVRDAEPTLRRSE